MALKYRYKAKDEIPPEHQAVYVERDGAWHLDVEGVVEQSALEEARAQSAQLAEERDNLNERLSILQIDQGVLTAASRHGLRSTAGPDLQARARAQLRLVDGVVTVLDKDGKTARKGRKGAMTVEEWVETQAAEAPHLFESNSGSGAAGNPASDSALKLPATNPWKKESWNMTEQALLTKSDPAMAARLRELA